MNLKTKSSIRRTGICLLLLGLILLAFCMEDGIIIRIVSAILIMIGLYITIYGSYKRSKYYGE